MRRVISGLFVVIVIFAVSINAQSITNVSKVGTTAAQFLDIGVGSRAIGMGEAFSAVADDATAIYYNPSGIANLSKNEVIILHTKWLADIYFGFVAATFSLGKMGTIGASITTLNMGDMVVRTVDEPDGTGEMYTAADFAAGLSYAKSLTDRFSIGGSIKYIHQQIWHMSASAIAVDIGTLFTTQFNDMKIGMSISNFGNKIQLSGKDTQYYFDIDWEKYGNNDKIPCHLDTDKWALPLIFRVGIAINVINSSINRATLAIDAVHPNNNSESLNLGMEYGYKNFLYGRVGFHSLFVRDGEGGATFGGGIRHNIGHILFKFNYSYTDFGRLTNAQCFSVGIEF